MKHTLSAELTEFFSHFTFLHYKKGERILRENETPSGVFLLTGGIVRTYFISEEGNELTLIMHEPGTIFPLRWALGGAPNIYNYQAMTDCELWRAPKDGFNNFLSKNPAALTEINQQLIKDFSALAYRAQHIVFGNAYARVASVILTAAKNFGAPTGTGAHLRIDIPFTHQQIADSAGVTRETASLEMKKLKENQLVSYEGRTIIVRNLKELTRISFL